MPLWGQADGLDQALRLELLQYRVDSRRSEADTAGGGPFEAPDEIGAVAGRLAKNLKQRGAGRQRAGHGTDYTPDRSKITQVGGGVPVSS